MISAPPMAEAADLHVLLEIIYHHFHYDFRGYARGSLERRLCLAQSKLGCRSLSELSRRILTDRSVFSELLQVLTVQVSDMFRDPHFYRILREDVVPILRTYPSLKVWVAGCSAGEELYSVAILLREEGLLDRSTIYATDVNPAALRKAEAGVYPLDRIATFAENHLMSGGRGSLSRYYVVTGGFASFDPTLRRGVVFADHDLATDSVFAEVHVISCRNVLIYFDDELRYRVMKLFEGSLCRRGFLGLGSKESLPLGPPSNAFCVLSPPERWYRLRSP